MVSDSARRFDHDCLVCGAPLHYGGAQQRACLYCGEQQAAEVACNQGHFVCDRCHALPAEALITTACLASEGLDPLRIAAELMHDPRIKMHGPEHHFLVPAVLLAASSNLRGEQELKAARLDTARQRAKQVKGGFCGHHGACGAGIGAGIYLSVLLEASPLSGREWQLANLATAEALKDIADQGGPRCCKRDTFLAIGAAARFVAQHLELDLPLEADAHCSFHARNRECRVAACPYFPVE